ncbi:MAG: thermonuclease family protein [Betaproteobacteria bacterium]|jgi:endonuclease YncB( thermonuclease family)
MKLTKYTINAIFSMFVFCFFSIGSHSAVISGETIFGKVVSIADGDTLTVLNKENHEVRIRLVGIDCPEKSQAFGGRAKRLLSEKVFGHNVRVETRGQDNFQRTLGVIRFADLDINEYLIMEGVAWHYKKYASTQPPEEAKRYANAEQSAKAAKRGLWAQDNPTPPWEFRAQKNKNSKSSETN